MKLFILINCCQFYQIDPYLLLLKLTGFVVLYSLLSVKKTKIYREFVSLYFSFFGNFKHRKGI